MQTDKIKVVSDGTGREEALLQVEKFAEYVGLDRQQELRLRLITEETLGMIEAIARDFRADYWIENDEKDTCVVHLKAETMMDTEKKELFMSASTSGKNEAAKGFMGKIRDLLQNGMNRMEDVGKINSEYGGDPFMFAYMGATNFDGMDMTAPVYSWSLQNYKQIIETEKAKNPQAEEAWDELEKSIVASIADDVRVAIVGSMVELMIEKKFD